MILKRRLRSLVFALTLGVPSALTCGALATLSACSVKVEPPTLAPRAVHVVGVNAQALTLRVAVDVTNPNSFPLIAHAITGDVWVDGTNLGKGAATLDSRVPANGQSTVSSTVVLPWSNLAALASKLLAQGPKGAGRPLPFTFRGLAKIGGEKLNTDVPFEAAGELTPVQLLALGLAGG